MRQLKITKSITNRESASLDKYLQEIGKEELITVEEEVELAQRIKKGDQEALGYYKREDSLIMSATVDGRRMETVEFSLSRMEVCQCRGKSNQLSAYHDRILNLVRDNIPLIRERMVV